MKSIFYLEDHKFFADIITQRLIKKGNNVVHVTTYKEAEEKIKDNTYDIALIDVTLCNGKTGIHFCEKYENKFKKILFVTGNIDKMTIETLHQKNWRSIRKTDQSLVHIMEFVDGKKEDFNIPIDDTI